MITFINLNKEKKNSLNFNRPGKYVVFFHNLSGRFSFELNSQGVDLDIFGLFTGKNSDEFKIETVQHHNGPNSTSNLLIKGVFDDQSKFIYQGLIRIEKKAQKSHAYQKNQNIILSEKCFVDSRPFLEILANDVFCTHGSTTGKLDKDQLYYLKTRGIEENHAKDLLIDGFINDLIDKVKYFKPNFQYV